jgi:ribosomal protein S21
LYPGRVLGPDITLEGTRLSLEVSVREGESQESLLRRFQRSVQMSGILREAKSHRFFVSKRDSARLKAKNNARRKRHQNHQGGREK